MGASQCSVAFEGRVHGAYTYTGRVTPQLALITHGVERIPICSFKEVYMCVTEVNHSVTKDNQSCQSLSEHQSHGSTLPSPGVQG